MVDNAVMFGRFFIIALLGVGTPAFGDAARGDLKIGCMLCGADEQQGKAKAEIPLRIEVTAKLSFSRIALTGRSGAQILVDPRGARQMNGDAIALGGYPVAGSVVLTGEPGRSVRIDMPRDIAMLSSTGGRISIEDMRTTLGPSPRLDNSGRLDFSFGGRIAVRGNTAGRFRGRIPITANYE